MSDPASSPSGGAPVVLVVEDDADVRGAAVLLMRRCGFVVREAEDPAAALAAITAEPVDAVLLDLNFRRGATGGDEGLACLADLRAAAPSTPVVVVTAHSGVVMAVAAMRAGATDFVTKPWSNRKLATVMEAAVARGRAERASASDSEAWLGESAEAVRVRDLVRRAAPLDASVLVWGPAGAGKSLISRLLHAGSPRAGRWVEVDLRGQGPGPALAVLAAAEPGALALQGVEALDAVGQATLASALARPSPVRVIAQSREPPAALRDRLGGELLYRLAALEIEAPPLHRRGADAVFLARHWLALVARRRGVAPRTLPPETETTLIGPWPDEARGLRLLVERAAFLGDGPVRPEELVGETTDSAARGSTDLNLARSEKAMLQAALERWSFNVSHAARELGLTRAALYRRMAKHGL